MQDNNKYFLTVNKQNVIASRSHSLTLQELSNCLLTDELIMKTFCSFCICSLMCNWFFASSIFKTGTEYLWIYMRIFLFDFCVIIVSLLESSSQKMCVWLEIKYTFCDLWTKQWLDLMGEGSATYDLFFFPSFKQWLLIGV